MCHVCAKTSFSKGGNACNHLLQPRCHDLSEKEKYHPLCQVWVKTSFSKGGGCLRSSFHFTVNRLDITSILKNNPLGLCQWGPGEEKITS